LTKEMLLFSNIEFFLILNITNVSFSFIGINHELVSKGDYRSIDMNDLFSVSVMYNKHQEKHEKKFGAMKMTGKKIYVVVVRIWVHVGFS
jgi:hypothetical protein